MGVPPDARGAVSTDGVLALAPSFDTVSWLTRDPATLRAVGGVLLPDDTAPVPTRATWSPDVNAAAEPSVREQVEHGARILDAEELPGLPDLAAWTAAFRTVQAHEAWAAHGTWLTTHPGAVADDVASRFAAGSTITDDEVSAAWDTIRAARATMTELLTGRFLVLPTVGSPIPRVNATAAEMDEHRRSTLRLTTLASLTGFPGRHDPGARTRRRTPRDLLGRHGGHRSSPARVGTTRRKGTRSLTGSGAPHRAAHHPVVRAVGHMSLMAPVQTFTVERDADEADRQQRFLRPDRQEFLRRRIR